MEYSNGWRLSNGRRIFLPIILRDRQTLKEVRRFETLDKLREYLEYETKLPPEALKMSRDFRFLFETPTHFVEKLG